MYVVAAEKLENDRVPCRTSDVTVNGVLSPNAASRIKAAAPLTVEWPEGYSGCGGVPAGKKSSQGVQAGSTAVAALPSISPLWRCLGARRHSGIWHPGKQGRRP